MERMKGQAFLMGSILFSGLIIIAFITTGPTILEERTNTRNFFSQTLNENSNVFNQAIKERKSIDNLKREIYSFDRFVERQALEKGINYYSYSFIILPKEGKGSIINYHPSARDFRVKIDGLWFNNSIDPNQNMELNFPPGEKSITFKGPSGTASLKAASPRLVKHSQMNSSDENWENTLIG